MQTFTIFCLLILVLTFAGCYVQPMLQQGGFGEISWGASMNEISGITHYHSTGYRKFAYKEPDELKIGSATCQSIRYYFLDGKFAGVAIDVKGYSNWRALKALTLEKYGSLASYNTCFSSR